VKQQSPSEEDQPVVSAVLTLSPTTSSTESITPTVKITPAVDTSTISTSKDTKDRSKTTVEASTDQISQESEGRDWPQLKNTPNLDKFSDAGMCQLVPISSLTVPEMEVCFLWKCSL